MRVLFSILLFGFSVLLVGQELCPLDAYVQEKYENPHLRELSKYDVHFYYLSLEISNRDTEIEGFAEIGLETVSAIDTLVFQLATGMEVSRVEVDGSEIGSGNYFQEDDALLIAISMVEDISTLVRVYYAGDANQDRGFFAGMSSKYDSRNKQYVTYTLSEPLNAKDWFPVKQVLNDKADSVWVDIICKDHLLGGSNGLLTEIEDLGGGKHKLKWRTHYPMAYYLISVSVGTYRDYSFYAPLSSGDSVLVQNYIYDSEAYFSEWKDEIDETGDMIALFSDLIGEYPFVDEKYGHCVAPMGGGMEHQTMTTIANFGFSLVAHELAHMWFGDDVTCGNWQDIWINEGFASYMEYVALQNLRDQDEADDWLAYAKSLAKAGTGSLYVPKEEADDAHRVFDYYLSYKKGACLLHMIRYELDDDELFFSVLREYRKRFGDGVAVAYDFRSVLEELSGKDFSCFFAQWYYGNGFPRFSVDAYQEGDSLYIESTQSSNSSSVDVFRTPFDLRITDGEGVQTVRLFQDELKKNFVLPVSGPVYGVSFDPNGVLLAEGSVSLRLPDGKEYMIGPNPLSSVLNIRLLHANQFSKIALYNLNGVKVASFSPESVYTELDMSGFPDGAYVLRMEGMTRSVEERIVKGSNEP